MISTTFHLPPSSYKIEQVKGKIGIVIKVKDCKACDDSKSDSKKFCNNIIIIKMY